MEGALKQSSVTQLKEFMDNANCTGEGAGLCSYFNFTIEPLYIFRFGISKLLKECSKKFLDSNMEALDKSLLGVSIRAI